MNFEVQNLNSLAESQSAVFLIVLIIYDIKLIKQHKEMSELGIEVLDSNLRAVK